MPFQIIRNDITKVEADAIVNTANPDPIVGGGTDWAIHTAAGPALLEERKKIGPIAVGESAATPAFQAMPIATPHADVRNGMIPGSWM